VEHYAGIDVSLELSSVCVVNGRGKIVKEAKVASEPEALVCFFKELGVPVNRVAFVREDAVCRRLMTVPGVGPVVAVTFKSAVDDPSRITKSKAVGALFGLTPRKYQSGEKDVTGGIT
jgi:hypothetical protein